MGMGNITIFDTIFICVDSMFSSFRFVIIPLELVVSLLLYDVLEFRKYLLHK